MQKTSTAFTFLATLLVMAALLAFVATLFHPGGSVPSTTRVSLRGSRKLQSVGSIFGSSSFIANTSNGSTTTNGSGNVSGTSSTSGTGFSNSYSSGPTGRAAGNTVSGGAGSGTNTVKPTAAVANQVSTAGGNTAINANGNFAAEFGPVTGGRGAGSGILSASSTGTGTGITDTSTLNNANVFAGGQAVAANQFGSAGGLGSGASTVASLGGTTANLMGGPTVGTGTATGNFNNAGVGAFVVPPNVLGATGSNVLGATGSSVFGATGSNVFGATGSITANSLTANSFGSITGNPLTGSTNPTLTANSLGAISTFALPGSNFGGIFLP